MRTARRTSATLHRWTGFVVGLVLAYMAATGTWLALKPQLNSKINSAYLKTTSLCETRASLDTVVANALRVYPHSELDSVWVMGSSSSSTIVRFKDQMQGYFDPCSGELIIMRSRWSDAFGIAEYLHRFLFLDARLAELVPGTVAAIAVLLTCLGLFTWWPRRTSAWKTSLKIDPLLQGRARFRNRHAMVGFLIAPVLFVMAIAGTSIAFEPVRNVLYLLTGSNQIEKPKMLGDVSETRAAFDKAWKSTLFVAGSPPAVTSIISPAPGDPIEVRFIKSGSSNPKGYSYLFVDPVSGEVRKFLPYEQAPAGDRLYAWLVAIHVGLVGGWFGQMLIILTMFGVVYLAYSGMTSFTTSRRSASIEASKRNIDAVVADVADIAEGVKCFRLSPIVSDQSLVFDPGAHVDIVLPDGNIRQYSLCNGPRDRNCFIISVKLEEGGKGGSKAMHNLVAGQNVVVSRPRNHFPLVKSRSKSLLFAAGIGITPIFSMVRHLVASALPFELHYYGRNRDGMAFADELEKVGMSNCIHLHVGESRDEIASSVRTSMRTLASGSHVYACGPNGFMTLVGEAVASARLPAEQFHRECFHNDTEAANPLREAFDVVLARSGDVFTVMPDESLLAALVGRGIPIESSCEQGTCGSCELRVVSGDLDHRDCVLSTSDRLHGKKIMACVSRCRGKLVLDV